MNRNLTEDRPTFVTRLRCGATGEEYPADTLHGLSAAGKPLLVDYDLDALGRAVDRETVAARPPDMWRYREFLPVRSVENIVSLGETMTPLVPLSRTRGAEGPGEVLVKDEGRLPTGSFKARGLCLAVSMAKELGVTRIAMPTNGNAGAALAAYGSRAGLETYVFAPAVTPEVNVREAALQGAKVWKVFAELAAIGWLGEKRPRMVAVQATGCAPIVKAWEDGADHAEPWEDAHTIASGIRVPVAIGDFLILAAVRESGGFAVAVSDDDIAAAQQDAARDDGLLLSPEGAATLAGHRAALASGQVSPGDRVVLFNCGNGLKYPMPPVDRTLDIDEPVDYAAIAAG